MSFPDNSLTIPSAIQADSQSLTPHQQEPLRILEGPFIRLVNNVVETGVRIFFDGHSDFGQTENASSSTAVSTQTTSPCRIEGSHQMPAQVPQGLLQKSDLLPPSSLPGDRLMYQIKVSRPFSFRETGIRYALDSTSSQRNGMAPLDYEYVRLQERNSSSDSVFSSSREKPNLPQDPLQPSPFFRMGTGTYSELLEMQQETCSPQTNGTVLKQSAGTFVRMYERVSVVTAFPDLPPADSSEDPNLTLPAASPQSSQQVGFSRYVQLFQERARLIDELLQSKEPTLTVEEVQTLMRLDEEISTFPFGSPLESMSLAVMLDFVDGGEDNPISSKEFDYAARLFPNCSKLFLKETAIKSSDLLLEKIAAFKNLEFLSLYEMDEFSFQEPKEFLIFLPNLKNLELIKSCSFSRFLLKHLQAPSLQKIRIVSDENVESEDLQNLSRFPQLRQLDLTNCGELTSEIFLYIPASVEELALYDLGNVENLDPLEKRITEGGRNPYYPHLRSLDLEGWNDYLLLDLPFLFTQCPQLQEIKINQGITRMIFTDDTLKKIPPKVPLQTLQIAASEDFTAAGFKHLLQTFPSLRCLQIDGCSSLCFKQSLECTQDSLQKLTLIDPSFQDKTSLTNLLNALPQLQELILERKESKEPFFTQETCEKVQKERPTLQIKGKNFGIPT